MTRRGREWHILATLDYPFLSSIFGFYPSLFPFPLSLWQDSLHLAGWTCRKTKGKNEWTDGWCKDTGLLAKVVHGPGYVLHTVHMTSASSAYEYGQPNPLHRPHPHPHPHPFFPFFPHFASTATHSVHGKDSPRGEGRLMLNLCNYPWEIYANFMFNI